jgi:uncharacterized protein (UPF0548 family)
MWLFARPAPATLRALIEAQATRNFSYAAVGATASEPPASYRLDRTCIRLGVGESVFERACTALKSWEQFRLGWVELHSPGVPPEVGQAVAVTARIGWLWTINVCRVVYMVDECGPVWRYGYAYGTLPEHVESGEERFTVEWDRGDDAVWYRILAFSRPNQVLARLGYPLTRRLQRRFARDSAAAMVRAVGTGFGVD